MIKRGYKDTRPCIRMANCMEDFEGHTRRLVFKYSISGVMDSFGIARFGHPLVPSTGPCPGSGGTHSVRASGYCHF